MRNMRADILIVVAAVLTRETSSEPCSSASLSTGGTSLVAETRTKVTVETGGDEDVLSKSLPGDTLSVEADTASISKEDVTEQGKLASQTEVLKEATALTRTWGPRGRCAGA